MDGPEDRGKSSPARVDDAIRAIVRDELGRPDPVARPIQPSFADAIFLMLFVVDVGLVLWLLSDTFITDPRWELLADIAPWAAGNALFSLGYAWWTDWFQRLAKRHVFRYVVAAAAPILTVLILPLVTVRTVIYPSTATIEVDGSKARERTEAVLADASGLDDRIVRLVQFTPGSHRIRIVPPPDLDLKPDDFEMSFGEAWRAWRSGNPVELSLNWPVALSAAVGTSFTIVRTNGPFPRNYAPGVAYTPGLQVVDPITIRYHRPGEEFFSVPLPAGQYEIRATGCTTAGKLIVNATESEFSHSFDANCE